MSRKFAALRARARVGRCDAQDHRATKGCRSSGVRSARPSHGALIGMLRLLRERSHMPISEKPEELDLELPALDGEDTNDAEIAFGVLDISEDDGGDAFDDATSDDPSALEIAGQATEAEG